MSRKSATLQRIRITPEMKGRLEQLALEDERTVSDYVRLVLKQHLKSMACWQELTGKTRHELGDGRAYYSPVAVWASEEDDDETKRPNN